MTSWKTYTLKELSKGKGEYGIGAPAVPFNENKYTYLRITDINDDGTLNTSGMMSVDAEDAEKYILEKNDIVFARTGNSTGRSYFYDGRDGKLVYAGFLIRFRLDEIKVNPKILKYYTHSKPYYDWVKSFDTGGTRGNINAKTYGDMPIFLPPRHIQDRIAGILGAIDDKIENNRRINDNLEQQAQALYKQWFVDNRSDDWEVGKVSDYYDITIGKTPPRKEKQWFSNSPKDFVWVSISDMGSCGAYISDSSEYLTTKAVDKFNIKVVPNNTVLLSFKLTVGRVAISDGTMTTNEAIAHFNTLNDYLTEYTYLALKAYNFANLGSTSSIATAVNSKIIKSMLWVMPNDNVLRDFHNIVAPIFTQIKNNIRENETLATLRDTLLPKLMNGEIKL